MGEFDLYISKHYKYLSKLCPDADVFHDTIIKCREHWDGASPLENYIRHAYKINCLREKLYAHNKYNCYGEDFESPNIIYNYAAISDLNTILGAINKQFGPELCSLYQLHLDGVPINEIEEQNNKQGLYYKFKKITNWTKARFH